MMAAASSSSAAYLSHAMSLLLRVAHCFAGYLGLSRLLQRRRSPSKQQQEEEDEAQGIAMGNNAAADDGVAVEVRSRGPPAKHSPPKLFGKGGGRTRGF